MMYESYCFTGETPNEWHTKGQLPIVSVKYLNAQVDAHHASLGQSVTAKDIHQFLLTACAKQAETSGIPALLSTVYLHR